MISQLPFELLRITFGYGEIPTLILYDLLPLLNISCPKEEILLLDSMEMDIERCLEKEFDSFPESFTEFKTMMSKTGACIAGSFPPQAIRQEAGFEAINEKSDIDIFVPICESDMKLCSSLEHVFINEQEDRVSATTSPLMEWFWLYFRCTGNESHFYEFDSSHKRIYSINMNEKNKTISTSFNCQLYLNCLELARSKSKREDWSDIKDFLPDVVEEAKSMTESKCYTYDKFESSKKKLIQVVHILVPDGNIESRRRSLLQWMSQNSDMDICKLVWSPFSRSFMSSSSSVFVASLLPCQPWNTQTQMQHHESVKAYVKSLSQKNIHWRFRKNFLREANRCLKYIQRGWNVHIDQPNLFSSVLHSAADTFDLELRFCLNESNQIDEVNYCVDENCMWYRVCQVGHEHLSKLKINTRKRHDFIWHNDDPHFVESDEDVFVAVIRIYMSSLINIVDTIRYAEENGWKFISSSSTEIVIRKGEGQSE